MNAPITNRLKSDNWDLHQIAERGSTPESMIKGTVTREAYAENLAQSIHIHRALDFAAKRAVEQMPELSDVILDEQTFEPFFAQDLQYFDAAEADSLSPGATRYIAHIQEHMDQPLHILGLHYVRLGACNGNRFVARKLRQVFGIDHPTDGMISNDPYGESQRPKWIAFKEAIDALKLSDEQREELFEGTRAAYVLTINLDHDQYMSDLQLLELHGKSLDREAFEQGHSVHV